MKKITFIIVMLVSFSAIGQKKNNLFAKNDIAPVGLQLVADYAQGWLEEVVYHPNALFRRYPGLNRNFWDCRKWHRWNANHLLKTIAVSYTHLDVYKRQGK